MNAIERNKIYCESSRRQSLNLREFMAMSNEELLVKIAEGGVHAESARWELDIRKINRVHRLNLRVMLISAAAGFALGLLSSLITAYMLQKTASDTASPIQKETQ